MIDVLYCIGDAVHLDPKMEIKHPCIGDSASCWLLVPVDRLQELALWISDRRSSYTLHMPLRDFRSVSTGSDYLLVLLLGLFDNNEIMFIIRPLFSCPILDNQNHCASTVAYCSVSFVFMNYCPIVD